MVLGRVRETRPGRARDVFLGYRRFLPLAVAGALLRLRLSAAPHTGSWHAGLPLRLLAVVVGFGVSLLLVSAFRAIVDQRLSLGSSLLTALRLLRPPELWRTLRRRCAHPRRRPAAGRAPQPHRASQLWARLLVRGDRRLCSTARSVIALHGSACYVRAADGQGAPQWTAARPTSASWCHSVPLWDSLRSLR